MLTKITNYFSTVYKSITTGRLDTDAGYRVIGIPQGSFYEAVFGGGTISPTKAMNFYSNTGAVATAVSMVGDEIANINPVLSIDGDLTDDDPLIEKLKRPNGFDTWSVFFEDIAKNFLITNNFFCYVLGTTPESEPIDIFSIKPQLVSGTTDPVDGRASEYNITSGNPAQGYYQREYTKSGIRFMDGGLKEVWHAKGYSSSVSSLMGESLLYAIVKDINEANRLQMIEKNYVKSAISGLEDKSDSLSVQYFNDVIYILRNEVDFIVDSTGRIKLEF